MNPKLAALMSILGTPQPAKKRKPPLANKPNFPANPVLQRPSNSGGF